MSFDEKTHAYFEKRFNDVLNALQSQTVNLTSIVQDLQAEVKRLEYELKKRDDIIGDLRGRLAELTKPKNVTPVPQTNPFNDAGKTFPFNNGAPPKFTFGATPQNASANMTPAVGLGQPKPGFAFDQQQQQTSQNVDEDI